MLALLVFAVSHFLISWLSFLRHLTAPCFVAVAPPLVGAGQKKKNVNTIRVIAKLFVYFLFIFDEEVPYARKGVQRSAFVGVRGDVHQKSCRRTFRIFVFLNRLPSASFWRSNFRLLARGFASMFFSFPFPVSFW